MKKINALKKAEETRKFIESLTIVHVRSPQFKDMILYIKGLQGVDGSFNLLKGRLPNDVYVYLNLETTLICTSLLIKAYTYNPIWFKKKIGLNILKKALNRCNQTYFWGHGYEGLETQLKMMKLFLDCGLKHFMKSYSWIDSKFAFMIKDIIKNYAKRFAFDDYNYGFGNYETEIKEVLKQYAK